MKPLKYQFCLQLVCAGLVLVMFSFTASAGSLSVVPASRQPVTNNYHGVTVEDDYQWLEDAPSAQAREWTRLENERTRAYYSQLPYRDGFAQQLTKLRSEESARFFGLQERK